MWLASAGNPLNPIQKRPHTLHGPETKWKNHSYQLIDGELCKPQVRAHVEAQINLVAAGTARREAVVAHTLEQFRWGGW